VRNFGRIAAFRGAREWEEAFRGAREGGGAVIFGDRYLQTSFRLSPKFAASATFVPRKRSPVIIDGRRA